MKYKNTTFVNILLIYSHYKPGKPFLKGAPFFWQPPVTLRDLLFSLCYSGFLFGFAVYSIVDLNPLVFKALL